MIRIFLICLFCGVGAFGFGQQIRVGILRSISVKSVSINVNEGKYTIYGDTTNLGELESVILNYKTNGVGLTTNGVLQVFKTVTFIQDVANSSLKVKSITPVSKQHIYPDNFEVTKGSTSLRIVNLADMSNYLAGVIESEGGGGRHIEYYKVQALMSHTYALKNETRHAKEGFSVCDGVHCQAFHNKVLHTPTIIEAVKATKGLVLVDAKNELVTSYFSANCGGQICDASYVWNTSVPYVQTFMDTFCIHTRQATWETKVLKSEWKKYLKNEFGVSEEYYGDLIYNFKQEERKAFYIHPSLGIPLRDLRQKFNLKSTYFDTRLEGESVIISGRGFGHGVGLCQEGAMQMAAVGFDFSQIARFYFYNVTVMDADRLQYFQQRATDVE